MADETNWWHSTKDSFGSLVTLVIVAAVVFLLWRYRAAIKRWFTHTRGYVYVKVVLNEMKLVSWPSSLMVDILKYSLKKLRREENSAELEELRDRIRKRKLGQVESTTAVVTFSVFAFAT